MRAAREFMGSLLFEGFDERHQIAFIGGRGRQDVQVIGHDAIGMDEESTGDRMSLEVRDEPGSHVTVGAETAAGFKAKSQEIGFSTEIMIRREPDVFALEG